MNEEVMKINVRGPGTKCLSTMLRACPQRGRGSVHSNKSFSPFRGTSAEAKPRFQVLRLARRVGESCANAATFPYHREHNVGYFAIPNGAKRCIATNVAGLSVSSGCSNSQDVNFNSHPICGDLFQEWLVPPHLPRPLQGRLLPNQDRPAHIHDSKRKRICHPGG